MAPVTGGEAEPAYMLASWAWVKERPDWDRKELVRPMDDGLEPDREGRCCKIGLGPWAFGGGVERKSEVEGEEERAKGWMECPDKRRAVTAAPD
jgi:hypothetical protein